MIKRKCPYCDKHYEGFTEKQAFHFVDQHILSTHKDKIIFKNEDEKKEVIKRKEKQTKIKKEDSK